jgi:hypothetical protein
MSIKKVGFTLAALLALSAVMASSAFATATTNNSFWYKSGAKIGAAEPEVACSKASEKLTLNSEIGTTPIELQATGISCSGKLKQEGNNALAKGTLTFTGVTMTTPAGCTVPSSLTTEALTSKIYMEGTKVYEKFEPTAGASEPFLKIPITVCSLASSPKVFGSVFGEAANATNVEATTQKLTFSKTINSTAGGELKLGTKAASLAGEVNNSLVGGAGFKANES